MIISRSGVPRILRGTAPALPLTTIDANALCAFRFLEKRYTQWLHIENLGPSPLRLYFEDPGLDPTLKPWTENYWSLPNGATLDGPYEIQDLWLAGEGAPVQFQALIGRRLA